MKGCGVGAVRGGCSECVSFYQVKERQGGGRCKIYLLPSENFDPGVVNLSKESSQLNRKHEEERGALGGGGGGGGAGMFGVVVRGPHTPMGATISKGALCGGVGGGGGVAGVRRGVSLPCLQS